MASTREPLVWAFVAVTVVGGWGYWQSRETDAEFAAAEGCRIYRAIVQNTMSRTIHPGSVQPLIESMNNAYSVLNDAATADRDRFAELLKAYSAWSSGAHDWVALHNLGTGQVDPADLPMAEQGYGAARASQANLEDECRKAPLHLNEKK